MTQTPTGLTNPIGSNFESPQQRYWTETSVPPWVLDRPTHDTRYLQTGRQALSLVASELHRQGITTIAMPDFLCDSMVRPFMEAGLNVDYYPVNLLGEPQRPGLEHYISTASGKSALLMAAYFGSTPTRTTIKIAKSAQRRSIPVVVDETHHPFSANASFGTWHLASLRKCLPVAEGAYIQGPIADDVLRSIAPPRTHDGWLAMRHKSMALAGPSSHPINYRDKFADAARTLEGASKPHHASDVLKQTINRLDYDAMAARRSLNAATLAEELGRLVRIVNYPLPGEHDTPSHLVVDLGRPAQPIQSRLASRKIFCPIHWPEVPGARRPSSWPTSLISLPVDHRYADNDMLRIARALKEALR